VFGDWDADFFIEDALLMGFDPFSPEGFQKQVTSLQKGNFISKVAFASRRRS